MIETANRPNDGSSATRRSLYKKAIEYAADYSPSNRREATKIFLGMGYKLLEAYKNQPEAQKRIDGELYVISSNMKSKDIGNFRKLKGWKKKFDKVCDGRDLEYFVAREGENEHFSICSLVEEIIDEYEESEERALPHEQYQGYRSEHLQEADSFTMER